MSIKCRNECKRTLTSQEMVKLVAEIQFRCSKCRIVTVLTLPVAKWRTFLRWGAVMSRRWIRHYEKFQTNTHRPRNGEVSGGSIVSALKMSYRYRFHTSCWNMTDVFKRERRKEHEMDKTIQICKRKLTGQEMVKLVVDLSFRRSKCRIVTVLALPVAKWRTFLIESRVMSRRWIKH